MAWGRKQPVRVQCYPSGGSKVLSILGITLIVLGVLLIILCIPLWAWLALIGVVLIVIGVLMLKK